MTCIVGVAEDGKVYIGADSMAAAGWNKSVTALRKVFRVGEFVIGYTSSFRMGQILQYHLDVRHQQDGETDERYMVVAFIEAVRQCLKDKGFARVSSNTEEGGSFLVGYRGSLYHVSDDFQVNRWANNIAACGAGEVAATAAMLALSHLAPEDRIRRALAISAELCNGVCEPFHVEVLS